MLVVNTVLVWLSFLAFSFSQAPIPGPNEPHYLTKARHFLDRDFCAGQKDGDLFLDSSDAHYVFYAVASLPARRMTLEQTAFWGRLAGYALLAFGWVQLVSRLSEFRFAPVWSAWVFLGIAAFGNLSGEWIVGGIESKVFAYAFLFWSLARLADRRWYSAGAMAGLAISFHPVVGCWGIIAAVFAWCVMAMMPKRIAGEKLQRPDIRKAGIAFGLLVLLALPGLIPAVSLLQQAEGVDTAKADRIQIFQRLPHHLDPKAFKKTELGDYKLEAAWIGYGFLFLFWLTLSRRDQPVGFRRWFGWFVIATAVIAVAGYLIGDISRLENGDPDPGAFLSGVRIKLMKLYPFRLFDIVLPVAVAAELVLVLQQVVRRETGRSNLKNPAIAACLFVGFFVFSIVRPIADRNPSHMRPGDLEQWLETCRWVEANLPADAHVRTPANGSWAFKWYAQRAEYWSNKDCPQDAAGILEWDRRRKYLDQWNDEKWDNGYSKAALAELYQKEKITHMILHARFATAIALKPIYPPDPTRKSGYFVYRLKDALSKPEQ